MRILVVSYFLPPSLYPQSIQIGRLLARSGSEIGAVCGTAGGGLDHDFGLSTRLAFRLEVGHRRRLPGALHSFAQRFVPFYARIPDEFRTWIPRAVAAARTKIKTSGFGPDALVTFGEPMSDHLVGLHLKSELNVPWIAHFSDPWVDNAFRRHNPLANLVNTRLERSVIAAADRILFTSDETLELLMAKYPAQWRGKASVLPHSFDPTLYPKRTQERDVAVLRYLGNFYGHRTPVPLFRALNAMLTTDPKSLNGVRIELIGQTPRRMRVHSLLRALPHGLVVFRDTVPYSESLSLMSSADMLLVIDGADTQSVFLPSKLVEYVGSGAPIFGIVPPGTSAKLLDRLGAPIADPRKPDKVAHALRGALHDMHERRANIANAAGSNREVAQEYHIDRISSAFANILEETVAAAGEGRPRISG
jgi:hypothetical protein